MSAVVGTSPLASLHAAEEAGCGFDERFEFNAPRFYDFKAGSPEGEPLDRWFQTTATAGKY